MVSQIQMKLCTRNRSDKKDKFSLMPRVFCVSYWKYNICVLAISLMVLPGCYWIFTQETAPLFKDIGDAIKESYDDELNKEALSGLSFRDTELYGLFHKYPYDSSLPPDEQYPRVALTILDAPFSHIYSSDLLIKACWRLRAKIRKKEKRGKTGQVVYIEKHVPPFYWCSPRDIAKGVPLDGMDTWVTSSSYPKYSEGGNIKDVGWIPPATAVPNDLRHQKFWYPAKFGSTMLDGKMFASLLFHMGFDWTKAEDRRVWITEFTQARW